MQGRRYLDINSDILNSYAYFKLPDAEKAALVHRAMIGDVDPEFGAYFKSGFERARHGSWRLIRLAVFERDDHRCVYCGDEVGPFDCDHVTPVCKGGIDDMDNLATACVPCNRSKGSRTLAEWRQ